MLKKYLRRYPLALLVSVIIVLLSLLPIPDVELAKDVPFVDKWTHMVMYGGLTIVIWGEYLRSHACLSFIRLFLFAFLAPICYGGLMELLQAYCTTCRSGEWLDFAANATGVAISTLLGLLLSRLWRIDLKDRQTAKRSVS